MDLLHKIICDSKHAFMNVQQHQVTIKRQMTHPQFSASLICNSARFGTQFRCKMPNVKWLALALLYIYSTDSICAKPITCEEMIV